MNQYISNVYKLQSHCNQPNVDVSTGLRLAFNENIHQSYSSASMLLEDLSTLINHQENEIDRYIQAHGEEFRRKLAEKTQRHYHALIGSANESALRVIREKEAVLEKAARRKAELEARAMQLSAEAQVWEAKAKANEAVAAALQAQLQQTMVGCVSQGEVVAGGDVE
ncbi:putative E3 ubiquitin-protein ligase BOI [Helianthus annuus]|nr:putative E3 ubiquitin-protein ligase BOI [Helianthus annuus]